MNNNQAGSGSSYPRGGFEVCGPAGEDVFVKLIPVGEDKLKAVRAQEE